MTVRREIGLLDSAGYDGSLGNSERLARFLVQFGFDAATASAKARMFAANARALGDTDARRLHAYYVPGRIEVLGKHTDYAGGSTLIAAVERALCLVAAARDDDVVSITDTGRDVTAEFRIGQELVPLAGHWSNYPMTVARRIARNFSGSARGADIAFSCDIPSAAGISSSSAIVIAFFMALADANDVWRHPDFPAELTDPVNLSGYMGTIENGQSFGALAGDRGVGTFGGSGDHTAIFCSRAGHVLQYSYCPVRFRRAFPLPAGYLFAIASSGVLADKTGSAQEKYNRASRLASRVNELWRMATGRDDQNLAAALASGPDARSTMREIVARAAATDPEGDALRRRLEHFIQENEEVIPAAGDALARRDIESFGEWVARSQRGAEELLGNQVPETKFLAAAARDCGAVTASAFGGGFGGSVWALIDAARAEEFLGRWRERHLARFPEPAARSEFFLTHAGRPMFRLV